MSNLHSNNIVHRDLKPQNILENDYLFPKISDFGFSKVYHQNPESMTIQSTVCFKGTPIYIAPEIWKSNQYTKEGDVYAFSFILYEVITSDQPFSGYSSSDFAVEVIQSSRRPDFKYLIPDVYRSLIERCWDEDPKNCPTFDQIVKELIEYPEFITNEVDQDDFFDSGERILNIEDILQNRKSNLLRKVVIKRNHQNEDSNDKDNSKKKDEKEIQRKPQNFYEVLTKSECFEKLSQDAQKFFKYIITPDKKDRNLTLNRNNLSNLSNLLLSDEFANVLKLFDQIAIELKYPSHNFQKIFDAVQKIKENDLQRIHAHLLVQSREANFILGNNQALNSVTISPCDCYL